MKSLYKDILTKAAKLDPSLARQARVAAIEAIAKTADLNLDNHFNVHTYEYKKPRQVGRGGEIDPRVYGVGTKEHPKSKAKPPEVSRSLSTRYSPDRVGVQLKRIADGVYQDPYSGRIYDWNEGFTSESGDVYPGGSVALQTDLYEK